MPELRRRARAIVEDHKTSGHTSATLPDMTEHMLRDILEIAGIRNLQFLTYNRNGKHIRGQILLSKTGVRNLESFTKETPINH